MSLFQNAVLKKYIERLDAEKVHAAYLQFTHHFHNVAIQENIKNNLLCILNNADFNIIYVSIKYKFVDILNSC